MRSRTHEVQAIEFLAAVVRPEPGALGEHRRHAESRAAKRRQAVLEILRREQARGHDLVLQVRQQHRLQLALIGIR